MKETKKKWLLVCGVLLAGIFFLTVSSVPAAEKGPIKVGTLVCYTGPAPMQAKCITMGLEFAFDEVGQKAGGRPIQLFKEDTEANPTVGLTKVRRLVEESGVKFIVGPVMSHVAMAIHDYISKNNVILIIPCAFTRVLTSPEKARENVFRVVETTDQGNYPMGKWMVKNTPYRKMVVAGSDYAAGHHSMEAFQAAFEEAGGKVIKSVYPKLGTIDFSSFLPAMDVEGADALYAFFAGTDAVRFVQQYQEFGLKKRIPLYGAATINDAPYLDSMGDAAIGSITGSHYPLTLDTPENRAFVKAYKDKYGELPNRYAEYGYTSGKMIVAAAEALKGEIEDAPRVAKAIKSVAGRIVAPSGPLEFDQYNQRIINFYVVKTEKRDGKLVNVIIDRLGKVSQEDCWKWWNK
jgi:branched-chain amino acid transport system substrate-binding protein